VESEADQFAGLRERALKKQQDEARLRQALQQLLDPVAFERLSMIRVSSPETFEQVSSVILSLFQQGQLKGKLSDEMLKKILSRLLSNRREPEIKFKHK